MDGAAMNPYGSARDKIALSAMSALISEFNWDDILSNQASKLGCEGLAKLSYEIADSMMKARDVE